MSINQVLITGNLTRDAELRQTQTGFCILNFTVAVNERRKNQQGEWEDKVNFIDCKLFGSRAEKLQQYLTKGLKVAIAGRLSFSSWQKEGKKYSKLEVLANDIEFMTSRNSEQQTHKTTSLFDEDVPF